METGPSLFDQYLQRLGEELEMEPLPSFREDGTLLLNLGAAAPLILRREESFCSLGCELAPVPAEYQEALFTLLMKGNFLGLETGESAIGVDLEGKKILLSRSITYDLRYIEFKEMLEEVVNYAEHWRARIASFLQGFSDAPV